MDRLISDLRAGLSRYFEPMRGVVRVFMADLVVGISEELLMRGTKPERSANLSNIRRVTGPDGQRFSFGHDSEGTKNSYRNDTHEEADCNTQTKERTCCRLQEPGPFFGAAGERPAFAHDAGRKSRPDDVYLAEEA